MKIAIIELDYHSEVLYSLCKIFEDSEHQLSIFTKKEIFNEFENLNIVEKFNWYIKDSRLWNKSFLDEHISLMNKHDVIIFNTAASSFYFYSKLNFIPPIILRIHNVNAYFNRLKSVQPHFSLYYVYKDLSHIVRRELFCRDFYYLKKFMKKVDYFTFPDEKIQEYALKKGFVKKHQIAPSIPLAVYDPEFYKKEITDRIFITIPGTIDQRRRDYHIVLEAIKRILPLINRPIQFTLLGRPIGFYGKKIISKFERLTSNKFIFKYFKNRIKQEEFNQVMKETDFIIAPIVLNTRYTIYREVYGLTKISGSISDIIRYAKPGIFPMEYPINNTLQPIIDQYDSVEKLSELLISYINGDRLVVKNNIIPNILQEYSSEALRNKVEHFLYKINKNTNSA